MPYAKLGCALVVAGVSVSSWACPHLEALAPWLREPPPRAEVAAAFMTLWNRGDSPLRITAVTSPAFAGAMIHESVTHGAQVHMEMREQIDIAPGARVNFEPGGLHVMLMQPNRPIKIGVTIPLKVTCESGTYSFDATVKRD
jgi:periplasmic copper chaperone A